MGNGNSAGVSYDGCPRAKQSSEEAAKAHVGGVKGQRRGNQRVTPATVTDSQ